MRRDEVRRLAEQEAHLHADILELNAAAEKEERNLSSEEQERFDKMMDGVTDLRERRTRAERLLVQDREIQSTLTTPVEQRVDSENLLPATFSEYRARKFGVAPWDEPEVRSAYYHYMVEGADNLEVEEKRALSRATGAAGNFLVPTDFYDQVIRSLRFMGSVANLATEVTTSGGDSIQVPANTAHGSASWLSENSAYVPSDETFAQITLGANKATAKIIVSEELLQDSAFALDSFLSQEFGERIGVLENTAYIKGSGTGQPQGLLSSPTASNITTVTAAVGNAAAFTYAGLVTAVFSLPYQYRQGASFIVSDQAARNLYLMVDGQQRPLWSVNVSASGPDTFLGYPIYTDPDVPAPAAGNISVLFGNWKRAYMIRRVAGFSMQRQNELHSDNGQVGFRGYERVDGKVVLAAAGVAVAHSAT
jgi:HK97 family phage major capsid protein